MLLLENSTRETIIILRSPVSTVLRIKKKEKKNHARTLIKPPAAQVRVR